MGLYERILGLDSDGNPELPNPETPHTKISSSIYTALLSEVARGRLTGAQAQNQLEAVTGAPLTPEELAEAQTLTQTITSLTNNTAKIARAQEISDVFTLSESVPAYSTPQLVRTRLGV